MNIPVKIVNPVSRHKRRRKRNARYFPMSMRRVKVKGKMKYRHRPVFHSDTPGRLGQRSEKAVLNKRRKRRKYKHKSHLPKEVNTVAYNRKKKRRKVHNRKRHYKRRKRHNPVINRRRHYKRRRHNRRHYNRRRYGYRRRRRNPNGEMAALTTTNILQMGSGAVLGAVGPVWITSSFGIMGNMKYIAQVGIGLLGWWGLRKIGLRRMALPFVSAAVGVTAVEFARDTNLLSGLGNVTYSYQDIENLRRLQGNGLGTVMLPPGSTMGTVLDNAQIPVLGHDDYSGTEWESDN